MKHEWKKQEKDIYLPNNRPNLIAISGYPFFVIEGKGDPNTNPHYAEEVGILYALSYAVKMMPKKGVTPPGYYEYTVYPLEGIWDLSEEGKKSETLNKDELVYRLMIRQPGFVTEEIARKAMETVKAKSPGTLMDRVSYEIIEDGLSVQMIHTGPYDDEPASFALMKEFCAANNLVRSDLRHREIYISDPRKTTPDKLKTVLRYFVNRAE